MRALMLLRPPHPIPTFVTMANAPLSERDGGDKPVIWVKREVEYISRQNLTTKSVILRLRAIPIAPLIIMTVIPAKAGIQ
jgi:hypothetical protein